MNCPNCNAELAKGVCPVCGILTPEYGIHENLRSRLTATEAETVARMRAATAQAIETVCQEADRVVSSEKRAEYGDPKESLDLVAKMWSAILKTNVSGPQVALCMIALKIGREVHRHKRDNLVDISGYSKVLSMYEGD